MEDARKMSIRTRLSLLASFFILCMLHDLASATLVCDELPAELCAYTVSSMGARCMLQGEILGDNEILYKCKTSDMISKSSKGWIATDDCIEACGLRRMTVGISPDVLFDIVALHHLCSQRCQLSCPDLLHLHHEMALALGSSSLENMCMGLDMPHRLMGEFSVFGDHHGHFERGHDGFDMHPKCEGGFSCGGRHGGKGENDHPIFDPHNPAYLPPNSLPPNPYFDYGPSASPSPIFEYGPSASPGPTFDYEPYSSPLGPSIDYTDTKFPPISPTYPPLP